MDEVDRIAQAIRTADGSHTLGAGALAEALHAAGVRFPLEEADANPERRANGCQIYRVNQDPNQEHDATPGGSNTVCTVCGRWESNGVHR